MWTSLSFIASGGARQKDSRSDVEFQKHHRVFFRPGVRRADYNRRSTSTVSKWQLIITMMVQTATSGYDRRWWKAPLVIALLERSWNVNLTQIFFSIQKRNRVNRLDCFAGSKRAEV